MNFVCIGKILGTHGLKGYLKIKPDLALSEIIDQLVFLSILKDDTVLNFEVEKYFFNKSMLVTKFKRVDNIEEAKKLVGAKVICHENIYKMLNIGGDNYNELLGYEVFSDGQLLGCLDEYHDFKGNIVFEITNSVTKNCFLVSYNKQSVLSIDREQRRIVVNKNCIIENDF